MLPLVDLGGDEVARGVVPRLPKVALVVGRDAVDFAASLCKEGVSTKSSLRPGAPPCTQTGMEAFEGLCFLASFGPPGTGEKTQPFNHFHSHPGNPQLCPNNCRHAAVSRIPLQ